MPGVSQTMSTDVARRPATKPDKTFLWEATRQAYRDVVVRQWGQWDDVIQEANFSEKWEQADFEVVELAGKPVGAIWTTDEGAFLRLREVFLHPDHQSRGIGTQLVKQELETARRIHKPLRLRVLRKNRAHVLYERLGFVVTDESPEAVWMQAI